jgi:VWFA-related protein
MFLHFKALACNHLSSHGAPFVRSVRAASLSLALLFLLVSPQVEILGQDQEPVDEVLRVRTDLITVPVFVTNGRGQRVSGLRRQDFVVRDNGLAVEAEYFASGAERVALLFALDASGSAREIISGQRETALALFSRFGTGSRVGVLRFTETPTLALPFTTSSTEALAAFSFPALAGRRTAIFDAGWEAVRSFDTRDAAERRIIILVSDGLDTASARTAAQVINAATQRGVSFYVIHLPLFAPRDGRLVARPAAKGFRDLAEKTGGKYFMLGDAKSALAPRRQYDLAPVFQAIEEDLKGQYLLGYYPLAAARDGISRRIEVGLASGNNKGLRVQTLRREYVLKSTR